MVLDIACKGCWEKFLIERISIWLPNKKHLHWGEKVWEFQGCFLSWKKYGKTSLLNPSQPSSSCRCLLLDSQTHHFLYRMTEFRNGNFAVCWNEIFSCLWHIEVRFERVVNFGTFFCRCQVNYEVHQCTAGEQIAPNHDSWWIFIWCQKRSGIYKEKGHSNSKTK